MNGANVITLSKNLFDTYLWMKKQKSRNWGNKWSLAPVNKTLVSSAPLLKVTGVINGVLTPKDKTLVAQALLLKGIVGIILIVTPKDKTLVSQAPLLKLNEVIN